MNTRGAHQDIQALLAKFRYDFIVLTRRQENRYKQQQQEMEQFYTKYEKILQELFVISEPRIGDLQEEHFAVLESNPLAAIKNSPKPSKAAESDSEEDFIPAQHRPKTKKKATKESWDEIDEEFIFESSEEAPPAKKNKGNRIPSPTDPRRKLRPGVSPACAQHRKRHQRCPETCPNKPRFADAPSPSMPNKIEEMKSPQESNNMEEEYITPKEEVLAALEQAVTKKIMQAAFALPSELQRISVIQVPMQHDALPQVIQIDSADEGYQVEQDETIQGKKCSSCGTIIEGIRYKCKDCEDFNLCTACYVMRIAIHRTDHHFWKIKKPLEKTRSKSKITCEEPS